jgi:glycosyltransferase involved in cell wall biosynthesis
MSTNQKYFLAIISSCYNIENYIVRHLNSLDYYVSHKDCQVIIVDDGSTDSTKEILENYSKKTGATLWRQQNMGLSFSRKAGFQLSTAEYIWFVDGDDELSGNMLNLLNEQKSHSHLYVFDYLQSSNNKTTLVKGVDSKGILVNSLFCKVFRSSSINYEFFSKIDIGEDLFFTISFRNQYKEYVYVPSVVYKYHVNMNSLTRSYSEKWLQRIHTIDELNHIGISNEILRPLTHNMVVDMLKTTYKLEESRAKGIIDVVIRYIRSYKLPYFGATYYHNNFAIFQYALLLKPVRGIARYIYFAYYRD